MNLNYLQLKHEALLPDISGFKPFLAVLVVEEPVTADWRNLVSRWLVKSGCLYMMSWGKDSIAWDEAVDMANIAQFNNGEIPEDELVLIAEHKDDTLEQFLREAKISATQDCADFVNTLILHISQVDKEHELLRLYSES